MARRRRDDFEIEREFEERVEAIHRSSPARSYPEPQKRDRKKTKPPFLLRFLAWCGVILFCFVVGYVGTGYLVDKFGLNKPWNSGIDGAAGENGPAPAANGGIAASSSMSLDMQKATFSVFYPKDGNLVSQNVDVISRTLEDNIQEAVLRILKLGEIGDAVNVLHVFRDVDTVYLDLSGNFLNALNAAGAQAGSLLINGIVRTMRENFSLVKVRFLIDSRVVSGAVPVNLDAVWQ